MCVNISPRVVYSRRTGERLIVNAPCGYCVECLKKRQNDWKLRICHECESWSHCYFFTLTYRPDTLKYNVVSDVVGDIYFTGTEQECLSFMDKNDMRSGFRLVSTAFKKDVQDFVKRIREDMSRKLCERWNMKYFICAEYGPNPLGTKRPHYHGIILCNEEFSIIRPYFEDWRLNIGRIDFREVGVDREDRSSVANYISKYCAKGCFESRKEDIDNNLIEKAWTVMSKNIGASWLAEHREDYERFVPHCLSVSGDWSVEDIERFFSSGTDETLLVISELDSLIRNLRVYDGKNYGYKMPRYYYDRIINKPVLYENIKSTGRYSMRISPDLVVPNLRPYARFSVPFPITYETKVSRDKRYVPESFLSRALAYRLRQLADARDWANTKRLQDDDRLSLDSISRIVSRNQEAAKFYRFQNATNSLAGFYETNMWKHRELDD